MVDHVIAVRASRTRFEIGRGIAVTHTQRVEIRNHLSGIGKGEGWRELEPIGGTRNASALDILTRCLFIDRLFVT